ncbi:MAG: CapA family protein [Lachnospiraceae bacterium]|nr:CapA family protein [Lachnospiraceae bacterium]
MRKRNMCKRYICKRNIAVFTVAASVIFANGITVCAAPERMPDGTIFDSDYYAYTYPDVVAELGTDTSALYQHYVNFGKTEGRFATNPADAEVVAQMQEEVRKITLSFAGYCTLGGYKGQGGGNLLRDYYNLYGNDYFFQNVREIFKQDDITYVNLEGALTPYAQVVEKKYPIKGEPEYVNALLSGSIEVVNLANNHTYDCGPAGYDTCRQLLAENGIAYCGELETCTLERNGIKTGFIGLNCWSMNSSLSQKIQNLIADLKNSGCNIVCVMFHGGIEREYESNATTEAFAHCAIDSGADIVVGAHPHVVQGIEVYQGKIICYSLGNFSFGANKNPSDKDTFIFQQTFFMDNDGTVSYGPNEVIPCKISSTDAKNDYCPTPQVGEEYDRIMQKLAKCSQKYPVSYFNQ